MGRIKNTFHAVSHLNLFVEHDASHQNDPQVTRQQILATRIYLILIVTILFILIMTTSLSKTSTFETILAPTLEKYRELEAKYPTTLSCSCKQSTIPYGHFISVNIALHPVIVVLC